MTMYNLSEHSQNHSIKSERSWNYYRDKIDVDVSDVTSFKYKTKIVGKTPEIPPQPGNAGDANWATLNVEVTIPLKYLSNFWRFLDLPLIKCEVELDLPWAKNCVLIEHINTAGVKFMITCTKLYVPVVILSINDNINFLEKIK